jgi:hypothetical protein
MFENGYTRHAENPGKLIGGHGSAEGCDAFADTQRHRGYFILLCIHW